MFPVQKLVRGSLWKARVGVFLSSIALAAVLIVALEPIPAKAQNLWNLDKTQSKPALNSSRYKSGQKIQKELIRIGCLADVFVNKDGHWGTRSVEGLNVFALNLAQADRDILLNDSPPPDLKTVENYLKSKSNNPWVKTKNEPYVGKHCWPESNPDQEGTCNLALAGDKWIKQQDDRFKTVQDDKPGASNKNKNYPPGLAKLSKSVDSVIINFKYLVPPPDAPITYENSSAERESKLLKKQLSALQDKIKLVARINSVGYSEGEPTSGKPKKDISCGKCRLLKAFIMLRRYARIYPPLKGKEKDPDLLQSLKQDSDSELQSLAFDKISYKMLNAAYQDIITWNIARREFERKLTQDYDYDAALYDLSNKSLAFGYSALLSAQGTREIPDDESPLKAEHDFGVRCRGF